MWIVELYRRWRREVDLAMAPGPDRLDRLRQVNAVWTVVGVVPLLALAFVIRGEWRDWGWLTWAAWIVAGAWALLVTGATTQAYVAAYHRHEWLADADASDGERTAREPRMRLVAEGRRAVLSPSEAQIRKAVLGLRGGGPSSFAILIDAAGDYVQVAGGGDACVLERRDAASGRHYRACRPGGGAGDERLDADTALEAVLAFFDGSEMPADVLWRDVTEAVAAESAA